MEKTDNNKKTDFCNEWVYEQGDLNTIETENGLDISFRARVISDLLKCSICDGFFRNATTIRECLHTFCKYCISDYIYKKGSNCPKCNKHIGLYPFEELVFDSSIQNITDKILPQFKQHEIVLYERFIEKYGKNAEIESKNCELEQYRKTNCTYMNKKTSIGTFDIKYHSFDLTRHFYTKVLYPELNSKTEFDPQKKSCISNLTVRIKLVPLRKSNVELDENYNKENSCNFENKLEKPYILVAPQITVDHIRKYVIHKLKKKSVKMPSIYLSGGVLLPKNHSIEFICRSRRITLKNILVLEYHMPE
ncbi:ring domain [Cryptosporidium xiaoi]|uniref:Ring domain n=1 Tax=Cryptosporidium xiaoi TaxID=659607 RepID=A0AAV9XS99_9CRYT